MRAKTNSGEQEHMENSKYTNTIFQLQYKTKGIRSLLLRKEDLLDEEYMKSITGIKCRLRYQPGRQFIRDTQWMSTLEAEKIFTKNEIKKLIEIASSNKVIAKAFPVLKVLGDEDGNNTTKEKLKDLDLDLDNNKNGLDYNYEAGSIVVINNEYYLYMGKLKKLKFSVQGGTKLKYKGHWYEKIDIGQYTLIDNEYSTCVSPEYYVAKLASELLYKNTDIIITRRIFKNKIKVHAIKGRYLKSIPTHMKYSAKVQGEESSKSIKLHYRLRKEH